MTRLLLAALLVATQLNDVTVYHLTQVDLDRDGEKEEWLYRPKVASVVDVADADKPPLYDVDIMVKQKGKITLVGTLRNTDHIRWSMLRVAVSWRPESFVILFECSRRGGNPAYYFVNQKHQMVPLPGELFP